MRRLRYAMNSAAACSQAKGTASGRTASISAIRPWSFSTAAELTDAELTDSAQAAVAVAKAYTQPIDALRAARNGKVLCSRGRAKEVEWCAQLSVFNVGAAMDGVVIRPIE